MNFRKILLIFTLFSTLVIFMQLKFGNKLLFLYTFRINGKYLYLCSCSNAFFLFIIKTFGKSIYDIFDCMMQVITVVNLTQGLPVQYQIL